MVTHRQRREWLLKVALVELGLWIARGDGAVSRHEAALILQLLREWGATTAELARLRRIGEQRVTASEPPTAVLRTLPELLSGEQRPIFLETLAELAFERQPRCAGKVGRLLDVCRALQLDQLLGLKVVNQVAARHEPRFDPRGCETPTLLLANPLVLARALAELGLERVDPVAARRAYRRLTLQLHPDRHPEASPGQRELLLQRLLRVRTAYQQVVAAGRPTVATPAG